MAAFDRGSHVEDLPGLGDVVGPEHLGALPRADGRRGERAEQPFAEGPGQCFPDEILVRYRDEHRPARRDEFTEAPRHFQRVVGVLPEVVARVDPDLASRDAERRRPLGESDDRAQDVGDDILLLDAMGSGTRRHAAGMGAHESGTVLGRNSSQVGIRSTPRVIQDGRPSTTDSGADLVPPGVDADGQIGIRIPDGGYEVSGARNLLRDVDLVTWSRFYAADVDDVGTVTNHVVHALHRGVEGERRAAVVERVRRAIQDRHDLQGPAQLGFLFAPALIGRSFESSVFARVRSLLALHTSPRRT